jgi:hypothetical protein
MVIVTNLTNIWWCSCTEQWERCTIIKEPYQYAHSVHYYAHQLNVFMEKAASQKPQAHIFSAVLLQYLYFWLSQTWLAVLESVSKHIPPGSNSRWNCSNHVVNTDHENKETPKECFEKLQVNRNQATLAGARGLLCTTNDKDLNFSLFFTETLKI